MKPGVMAARVTRPGATGKVNGMSISVAAVVDKSIKPYGLSIQSQLHVLGLGFSRVTVGITSYPILNGS